MVHIDVGRHDTVMCITFQTFAWTQFSISLGKNFVLAQGMHRKWNSYEAGQKICSNNEKYCRTNRLRDHCRASRQEKIFVGDLPGKRRIASRGITGLLGEFLTRGTRIRNGFRD